MHRRIYEIKKILINRWVLGWIDDEAEGQKEKKDIKLK